MPNAEDRYGKPFRHSTDYLLFDRRRDSVPRRDLEQARAERLAEQSEPVTPFDR